MIRRNMGHIWLSAVVIDGGLAECFYQQGPDEHTGQKA